MKKIITIIVILILMLLIIPTVSLGVNFMCDSGCCGNRFYDDALFRIHHVAYNHTKSWIYTPLLKQYFVAANNKSRQYHLQQIDNPEDRTGHSLPYTDHKRSVTYEHSGNCYGHSTLGGAEGDARYNIKVLDIRMDNITVTDNNFNQKIVDNNLRTKYYKLAYYIKRSQDRGEYNYNRNYDMGEYEDRNSAEYHRPYFKDMVRGWIAENYQDPDLNLSMQNLSGVNTSKSEEIKTVDGKQPKLTTKEIAGTEYTFIGPYKLPNLDNKSYSTAIIKTPNGNIFTDYYSKNIGEDEELKELVTLGDYNGTSIYIVAEGNINLTINKVELSEVIKNTDDGMGYEPYLVEGLESITQTEKNFFAEAKGYANQMVEKIDKKAFESESVEVDGATQIIETKEISGKEYTFIGPYNLKQINGNMDALATITTRNGNTITTKYYSTNGTTINTISSLEDYTGDNFYIVVEGKVASVKSIKLTKKITINNFINARILFAEPIWGGGIQAMTIFAADEVKNTKNYEVTLPGVPIGNLKIIKANKNNINIKLSNVEFKIKQNRTGKYVKRNSNGSIEYVAERNASIFKTDSNGAVQLEGLIIGDYTIYETNNPNYGYVTVAEGRQKTVKTGQTVELQILNEQKYVKISGYVWLDGTFQENNKEIINNLFKDNSNDRNDIELEGIKVRIFDNQGQQKHETQTGKDGKYVFQDVLINELSNYYVEFEYDGIKYKDVVPNTNKDNGSKAKENTKTREDFNKNFATVEGNNEKDKGITRNTDGNKTSDLEYGLKEQEHKSELRKVNPVSSSTIKANTKEAQYNLRDKFNYGQEEIKNVNLGIYLREQPDMALVKDLDNIKAIINGYEHTYRYGSRFQNQRENGYVDGFNTEIKYGSNYSNQKYSMGIYRSDMNYINAGDSNKELKLIVTYKIRIMNESETLSTRLNSIVDYYDSNYRLVSIGTGINNQGMATGNLQENGSTTQGEYTKITVNTNATIEAQRTYDIYITYQLDRASIAELVNDEKTLKNVAEINSYSVFDKDGQVYAGIDKDSNPENAQPESKNTYQDDTDAAPEIEFNILERTASGTVFLDTTDKSLLTNEERKGDGKLETGADGNPAEPTVPGVTVRLIQEGEVVGTDTTDDNGEFKISGFTPGKYTIEYEWGRNTATDGTEINVYDYKGTIYNNPEREVDEFWYKDPTRNSDAKDNYNTRVNIDEPTNTVRYDTERNKDLDKTMISTTPEINVKIEYSQEDTTDINSIVDHEMKDIDFGIVERPRQQLELNKIVSKVRVTLANGQTITETEIDPSTGELVGNKLTNKRANPLSDAKPKNGYVRIEIDEELIQGATIEAEYAISVKNNSELDYINQEYYHYGTNKTNVLKLSPTKIIDYLDKNVAFDASTNSEWTQLSRTDLSGRVDQTVYMSSNSKVEDKRILHTEHYRGTVLAPGESTELSPLGINVSKLLTSKFGTQNFIEGNEAEIIEIVKNGGRTPTKTETPPEGDVPITTITVPGNYVPGDSSEPGEPNEPDDDTSEEITVTPSTGANLNYITPIATAVVVLVILGTGIYFIKKKVLD